MRSSRTNLTNCARSDWVGTTGSIYRYYRPGPGGTTGTPTGTTGRAQKKPIASDFDRFDHFHLRALSSCACRPSSRVINWCYQLVSSSGITFIIDKLPQQQVLHRALRHRDTQAPSQTPTASSSPSASSGWNHQRGPPRGITCDHPC